MHFLCLSTLAALVANTAAIPFPANNVPHERRDYTPNSWDKRARLDGAEELPVRIGLTQRNLDKGYDLLMEVSQHDSPKYGQHYTAEQVAEIFAPSQSTVDVVNEWLVSAGVAAEKISQSVNKQWIQFDVSAAELESLLQTKYHVYQHSDTGESTVACDEYHVPANIREHIDYITPGIKLFAPHRGPSSDAPSSVVEKRIFGVTNGEGNAGLSLPLLRDLLTPITSLLSTRAASHCDAIMSPDCIKALYKVPAGSKSMAGNELGIFQGLGDVYSQEDLNSFFAAYAKNIPKGTHPKLQAIDGATAPNPVSAAGFESDLDFQVSYPLIAPQGSILFQSDDPVYSSNYKFRGLFNTFLDAIDGSYCSETSSLDPKYPNPSTQAGAYKGKLQCGVYKPTNVISISYGGQEADLPAAYQTRQCAEFMKLGLQGVSIVLSSGDSGVAGTRGCMAGGKVFSPDFPATCPYITTVGGTYLPKGASVSNNAEVAVTRFPSGGGFSNIYAIPSYQSSAVSNYLRTTPPPYKSYSGNNNKNIGAGGGIYNVAGRAYPDVSAIADNLPVYYRGRARLLSGTSGAAPLFASLLNRINEERLAAGKSTVGFVNPTLYAHPEVLNDITVGSNRGCNTTGFAAAKGWDPVTGLGTPNYPAMLKMFMGL